MLSHRPPNPVLAPGCCRFPHSRKRRQAQGEVSAIAVRSGGRIPSPQITEFHHQHTAMAPPLAQGRRCQGF